MKAPSLRSVVLFWQIISRRRNGPETPELHRLIRSEYYSGELTSEFAAISR